MRISVWTYPKIFPLHTMTVSKGALFALQNTGWYMEEYELEHTGCARQEAVLVRGGNRLCGELTVQGAKNSTLPLLAAALLCEGETVLHNCPALSDVHTAVTILRRLGCRCTHTGDTLTVCADGMTRCDIPHSLMREMRSSIVFLGAILSRCGEARLSFPGGCELGPRPIDLHLEALRKLGAEIREEHGCLLCTAPGGLRGGFVSLAFPSVGATENLLLAAARAKGTTVLTNAAREPEGLRISPVLKPLWRTHLRRGRKLHCHRRRAAPLRQHIYRYAGPHRRRNIHGRGRRHGRYGASA